MKKQFDKVLTQYVQNASTARFERHFDKGYNQ